MSNLMSKLRKKDIHSGLTSFAIANIYNALHEGSSLTSKEVAGDKQFFISAIQEKLSK